MRSFRWLLICIDRSQAGLEIIVVVVVSVVVCVDNNICDLQVFFNLVSMTDLYSYSTKKNFEGSLSTLIYETNFMKLYLSSSRSIIVDLYYFTWLKDMSRNASRLYVLKPNVPEPPGQSERFDRFLAAAAASVWVTLPKSVQDSKSCLCKILSKLSYWNFMCLIIFILFTNLVLYMFSLYYLNNLF